jgi:hypothetical protein
MLCLGERFRNQRLENFSPAATGDVAAISPKSDVVDPPTEISPSEIAPIREGDLLSLVVSVEVMTEPQSVKDEDLESDGLGRR